MLTQKHQALKITQIDAFSLPDAWFQCLRRLFDEGHIYTIERGSYQGSKRLEFDYAVIKIERPSLRPLVPQMPAMSNLPPPTDMEYVERYLEKVLTSVKADREDYTYGQDIEKQIPTIIEIYKNDGFNTNQAYIAVGNADSLLLNDPQCLRGIDTRIRYGKLHFMLYFRSWDLWGGFPSNLAALQLVKEYMAGEIGVEDGEIIACSKGLHLYEHSWEVARMRVGKH